MKTHPISAFTEDIWKEIDFIFRRERIPCLPSGATPDGVDPAGIETTKRGVEISGTMSFLPTGSCPLHLCLSSPCFSTIESVTASKLRKTVIIASNLEGRVFNVVVTDANTKTDDVSSV